MVFLDPRPRAPVHVDGLCIKPPRVHPLSLLFCSSLSLSAQFSSAQQQLNHYSTHYTLHTTHYTTQYTISTIHYPSDWFSVGSVSSLSSCQLQLYRSTRPSPSRPIISHPCQVCGTPTSNWCSRGISVWYCSEVYLKQESALSDMGPDGLYDFQSISFGNNGQSLLLPPMCYV